jgi:ribosomal protein S12 methylthiotransferase
MKNSLRFYLLSLGCAKNTVDSQSMAQLLGNAGYARVADPAAADLLIVNTCGFIFPAREESLTVLRELAAGKQPGQKLIAAGCLSQLVGAELVGQVPGLDGVLGTRRWMDLTKVVERLRQGNRGCCGLRYRGPAPTSRSPTVVAVLVPFAPSLVSRERP